MARSTSQALLKSSKEVEAGRFLESLSPKTNRFLRGLTKSAEFVDRIRGGSRSSSSSGIFKRFFPTANRELRWREEGKDPMAFLHTSSEKNDIFLSINYLVIIFGFNFLFREESKVKTITLKSAGNSKNYNNV